MKIFTPNWLIDLEKTILWQYDKATKLQKLITEKQKWYKQNVSDFIVDFFNNIFNLKTANDFGLNIWGKILNFPRQIMPKRYRLLVEQTVGTGVQKFSINRVVFNSKIASGDDFEAITVDVGNKYTFIFTLTGETFDLEIKDIENNTIDTASNIILTDYGISVAEGSITIGDVVTVTADYTPTNLSTEQYRFLLLGQVLKFKMKCTIPEINRYLRLIFNEETNDNVYVVDNEDMTITYILNPTVLSPEIQDLIDNYEFLPCPVGVSYTTNASTGYYKVTINTNPVNANCVLIVNGQSYNQKSIDVELGTTVNYVVSSEALGFYEKSGSVTVEEEQDYEVSVILETDIILSAVPNTAIISLSINGGTAQTATGTITQRVNAGDTYSYTIEKSGYFTEIDSGIITSKIDRTITLQEQINLSFAGLYVGNYAVETKKTLRLQKTGSYHIELGGDKGYDAGIAGNNKGGTADITTTLNSGDLIEIKVIYGGFYNSIAGKTFGGVGVGLWVNGICKLVAGGSGIEGSFIMGGCGGGGYAGGDVRYSGGGGQVVIKRGYNVNSGTPADTGAVNRSTGEGAGYAYIGNYYYYYGGSGYKSSDFSSATLVYNNNNIGGYAKITYTE